MNDNYPAFSAELAKTLFSLGEALMGVEEMKAKLRRADGYSSFKNEQVQRELDI